MILSALAWPLVIFFSIFTLWMLWIIAKALKGVEARLTQIVQNPQIQN
jgi:hypothetical protein